MHPMIASAWQFVLAEARVLDQRLFERCFLDGPAHAVVDALRGYRNDDGGLGHGLEPDKRCPASLPIDVEVALRTLAAADAYDESLVLGACDFLDRVADESDHGGAVPLAFPVIEDYPRADHWTDWTYAPGLNPTAGLAGHLHRLGVDHPWLERATEYCWGALDDGGGLADVHELSESLIFLEHVPDRQRAVVAATALAEHLGEVKLLNLDPAETDYGLTPLHLAHTPESPWRAFFTDEQIDAHLDRLAAGQQEDGGWPITWDPPSEASRSEWRAIWTIDALLTLRAYGRLEES
jgi:hypothetical protein